MNIPTQLPEFNISLKTTCKPSELYVCNTPADVVEVARKCFDADKIEWVESFIAIALSKSNKVLGFYKVSQGGITGTVADPRVILQFALLSNATTLIIAHNHPSGNITPSRQDEELTKKIKTAASYFDIRLLDHIIVTSESYYSFADEGIL